VENPEDPANLLILFAGTSAESTLQICDSYFYDPDASFAIFDGDEVLLSGDWEREGELMCSFDSSEDHPTSLP
jgi:hypothetical protein